MHRVRTDLVPAILALLSACAGSAPGAPEPAGSDGGRSLPAPAPAHLSPAALRERCDSLVAMALQDSGAKKILAGLVAAAPHRLSGSAGAEAAVQWALEAMRELGMQNVRAEPVLVPHWVRGEPEECEAVAPERRPLRVLALGGSEPTPAAGITAEVVEVRSFRELQAMGEQARGKIVFFNRPMPRALRRTFMAYGQAVPQRSNGAVEAARAGGVAALVRSMTTAIDGFPHTGAMRYQEGVARVPAAAIATEDADWLSARLSRGPVTVRLRMSCQNLPDVWSAQPVGELPGRELAGEIVLISGHLDAWDAGEGAHDDGAGCAHVLEAVRLLQQAGIRPRRTIRAVLWMNEENGLRGADAYVQAHRDELARHVAAFESDAGGFAPEGFTCSLQGPEFDALEPLLAPLDAHGMGAFIAGGGGGADIGRLGPFGVPLFGLLVASHRYFDYHHSARDTLDAVHERELALGAAALAYAASVLADR